MADAEDIKRLQAADHPQEQQGSKTKQSAKTSSEKGAIPLLSINMVVVITVCGAAGAGLGRFAAHYYTPRPEQHSKENAPHRAEYLISDVSAARKAWHYDLEPVVANLDEPGMTCFVRADMTLEISPEVDPKKGAKLLDLKKPLLRNWLTIYLAGQAAENVKGDKNLKRVQAQILDAFNEILFPDAKPQVVHVLFKEFAMQ